MDDRGIVDLSDACGIFEATRVAELGGLVRNELGPERCVHEASGSVVEDEFEPTNPQKREKRRSILTGTLR
jgi:hypothetical protein